MVSFPPVSPRRTYTPPLLIASHLKILIPAGTAMVIVADVKYVCVSTSILTYLLTYLLTYSMVQSPFEKLTGLQLVKKIPAFHGT